MDSQHNLSTLNRRIGTRLRLAREQQQLTVAEVASETGLTMTRIGQLEEGDGNLLAAELSLLADALEMPLAFFLEEDPRRHWTGEWQLLYSFRMLDTGQQHDVMRVVNDLVGEVRVMNRH